MLDFANIAGNLDDGGVLFDNLGQGLKLLLKPLEVLLPALDDMHEVEELVLKALVLLAVNVLDDALQFIVKVANVPDEHLKVLHNII
jgi:hypothetical protein